MFSISAVTKSSTKFVFSIQYILSVHLYILFYFWKVFLLPVSATPTIFTAGHPRQASQAKSPKDLRELPPEPSNTYSELRKKVVRDRREKNTRMVDKEKLLEERLQRLEREISDSKAFSNQRSSAGRVEEPLERYCTEEQCGEIEWREVGKVYRSNSGSKTDANEAERKSKQRVTAGGGIYKCQKRELEIVLRVEMALIVGLHSMSSAWREEEGVMKRNMIALCWSLGRPHVL